MKILGTGLGGLIGSRIVELLKDKHELESSDVDITVREEIVEKITKSGADLVLHLAAKTSVDGCERDHSSAWAVNVYGTQNVIDACEKAKKKIIFFSTGFVFDGKKEKYDEEDLPNAVNWYGKSKQEGEKIIKNSSVPWVILRIDYPYRANFTRSDFVRTLIEKLKKGESLQMVTDHIMSPTFIDDIVLALDTLIKNNSEGIYHVVGSDYVSPYEAAKKIAKTFGFNRENISKTTRLEYFKDRAQRPFHLALKNDKIRRLGISMKTFEEGLEEVKRQMKYLS
jgi:dTDP-4-dehydrorhamnose reductase